MEFTEATLQSLEQRKDEEEVRSTTGNRTESERRERVKEKHSERES